MTRILCLLICCILYFQISMAAQPRCTTTIGGAKSIAKPILVKDGIYVGPYRYFAASLGGESLTIFFENGDLTYRSRKQIIPLEIIDSDKEFIHLRPQYGLEAFETFEYAQPIYAKELRISKQLMKAPYALASEGVVQFVKDNRVLTQFEASGGTGPSF